MRRTKATQSGFSVIELLVTMTLATVMAGASYLYLEQMTNPVETASAEVVGFMKMARARAVATTMAYIVEPSSTSEIATRFGTTCDAATTTNDEKLTLRLPDEVSMNDLTWSVCFTTRGFTDANDEISLVDLWGKEEKVEVFLGGGVRIQ